MRQERTVQASIFDLFAGHEIGRELKAMSAWLDDHRELLGLLRRTCAGTVWKETGRCGLPAESVLRCAVLKQHRQLSYQEVAFHLEDSASFRAFARLPHAWSPKKSVLHKTTARSAPRPGSRSIARCSPALGKRSWKAVAWCGWTARSPRLWCTSRATAACCGMRSG